MIFVSGILISDTEEGAETNIGSFCTKVDVNMKKVSRSTVTSLMAVMSIIVLFLLILILGMVVNF
jgi:hypothetical protein